MFGDVVEVKCTILIYSMDNFLFSDCLQNSFGGGGASLAWSTKFRSETDLVFRKGSGAE